MKHQTISFNKSAIRIVGYITMFPLLPIASVILIISEVIGIVEEIGHE